MSQAARTLAMLAVLLAVGVALGLYAWKSVYEGEEQETKQKDVEERLFSALKAGERSADGAVPAVDFVKLTLVNGAETTVLERASGADPWKITSPVQARADKFAADGVVSQLQTAKFKYVADEAPDDEALSKYGLKTPSFVVEAEALVGDAKERRSVRLEGGAENTFNGSIFMRRNDEQKVWGAEGGVKWSFQKATFDLRDKELVAFDEQQVERVTADTQNNHYVLERDADRQWVVKPKTPGKGEEPVFLADQGAISGSLSGLKNERATAFPSEVPLGPPFEDLVFEAGPQKVQVKLWRLMGADGGPQKVVALRQDPSGTVIAELNPTALGHFDRYPWDLRDRSLVMFKKDAVAKVTFHLPSGAELVVEKDASDAGTAETWRVTAPKTGPAKQFKIAALLWTVGSLKGTDVIEDRPKDLKKYGFDRWIALAEAGGKELGRLWVGADVPGQAGTKYLRGTRDQVVAGDSTRLADLPTRLEDLLDAPATPDAGPAPQGP